MDKYIDRLIKMGEELKEQLDAETEGGPDVVPFLLSAKIYQTCGFIESLKYTQTSKGRKRKSSK